MMDWPQITSEVREARGWSQREMAARFRVRRATVSDWETGRYEPQGPAQALLLTLRDRPDVEPPTAR